MLRMQDTNLTQERLKALVHYDPDNGFFTWNMKRRRCRPGDMAGCRMKHGYICIRIDDILYTAHRLAWFYMTGQWPADQIDHINGVRHDNRFANLREATNLENTQNCVGTLRRSNKSGYTGVRKDRDKWVAEIKTNYKGKYLGRFDTAEEAYAAYLKAKHELHPFSRAR